MSALWIHPDIRAALNAGDPVVALESAVLTHGLPRSALGAMPACRPAGWLADSPTNLETMRAMQRAVQSSAAAAAVVGVHQGSICIGMRDESVASLAADPTAAKASARDLAPSIARGVSAGATVSATLAVCATTFADQPASSARGIRASSSSSPGIRVFATGGIGGVHRGWPTRTDISADLIELSRTPVCVVCSGPKAVLDVPATAEALEALGVLVMGYQTDVMPQFYSCGHARIRLQHRVQSAAEIAEICRVHWQQVGRTSAVLVCQPPPAAHAMQQEEVDRLIARAIDDAARDDVEGPAVTPFLLDRVAALSEGRSLEANIALLVENARLAGQIAAALCSA
jgi:pseudouridine-5'-phosphate glycosidase